MFRPTITMAFNYSGNVSAKNPQSAGFMNPSDARQRCLIEVARQIVDPESGITKDMVPPPVTLGDWRQCLQATRTEGWVSAGIEEDIAEMIQPLGIGQVVASVNPDLSIYSNNLAPHFIHNVITGDKSVERNGVSAEPKNYRLIANYNSFVCLAQKVKDMIPKEVVPAFCKDMDRWTKEICPRVFWINVLIPERIATHLRHANIGEVITSGGNSDFMNLHEKPKDDFPAFEWKKALEDIENEGTDGDDEGESEDEEGNDWDEKLDRTCGGWDPPEDQEMFGWKDLPGQNQATNWNMTKTESKDNSATQYPFTKDAPFRLIMNQSTILALITLALQKNGVQLHDNVRVFDSLGGRDADLVSLFSRMAI